MENIHFLTHLQKVQQPNTWQTLKTPPCHSVQHPARHRAQQYNERHEKWLQIVHKVLWLRADTESMNMHSTTAIRLHYRMSPWVIQMWNKSIENDINMPAKLIYRKSWNFCCQNIFIVAAKIKSRNYFSLNFIRLTFITVCRCKLHDCRIGRL